MIQNKLESLSHRSLPTVSTCGFTCPTKETLKERLCKCQDSDISPEDRNSMWVAFPLSQLPAEHMKHDFRPKPFSLQWPRLCTGQWESCQSSSLRSSQLHGRVSSLIKTVRDSAFWLWVSVTLLVINTQRQQTFSVKGQIISILKFVGLKISVATTQLCHCSLRQPESICS